jgi:hypothetical protein
VSTVYPSYENVARPSYLGTSYSNISDMYPRITVGMNVQDMPKTPRLSNLSTPSNLSGEVPFNNTYILPGTTYEIPGAPRPSNLSTPSNLSGEAPFNYNYNTVPNTPRYSNLSTPSDLSSANSGLFPHLNTYGLSELDPNLIPRPLNPLVKTPVFRESIIPVNTYTMPHGVPTPMPDNYNPYNYNPFNQMVPTNRNDIYPTSSQYSEMRHQIIDRFHKNGFSSKIVLLRDDDKGRFELNFDFVDRSFTKLKRVYIKFHDVSKRKIS